MKNDVAQNIKDCGQALIDNAENIAANLPKYSKCLSLTCWPGDDGQEVYINVSYDFVPEKFIERCCSVEDTDA